jgi:hypothetical protein
MIIRCVFKCNKILTWIHSPEFSSTPVPCCKSTAPSLIVLALPSTYLILEPTPFDRTPSIPHTDICYKFLGMQRWHRHIGTVLGLTQGFFKIFVSLGSLVFSRFSTEYNTVVNPAYLYCNPSFFVFGNQLLSPGIWPSSTDDNWAKYLAIFKHIWPHN